MRTMRAVRGTSTLRALLVPWLVGGLLSAPSLAVTDTTPATDSSVFTESTLATDPSASTESTPTSLTADIIGDPSVQTVSALTAAFFANRRVGQIVLFVCGDSDRTWLLRHLAADGRFQVEAPPPSLRLVGERLLRHQSAVGVLVWPTRACGGRAQLDELTDSASFNGSFRWLLVDPGGPNPAVFENLDDHLRLDSEVTVARPLPDNRWELVEVFRADEHRGVLKDHGGFWSPAVPGRGQDGAVAGQWDPGLAVRRLHVPDIPISAVHYMWRDPGEDVLRRLHLMSREEAMPLITPLAKHGTVIFHNIVARYRMNVTRLLANTRPGQLEVPAGAHFDGVVGDVESGAADVALALFSTPDRERVMVFAHTTWTHKTMVSFMNKGALGSVDALVKVFDVRAWVAVMVVSAVIASMNKNFRSLEHLSGDSGAGTWSDVFISAVSTLAGQGFFENGEWFSGRWLLFVFEMFCFLTQAYYGAGIVTFLLRPPASSIRDVRDLVGTNYKGVGHDWIHTRRIFENATDPLMRELFERKINPPKGLGFLTTAELMASLKRPGVALFGSDDVLDEAASTLTSTEACSLQQLDVDPAYHIGLGISKKVPFKELLFSGTSVQVERGIAHREKRVLRLARPACERDSGGGAFAPVDIMPVLATLVPLAVGVCASTAICIAERTVRGQWCCLRHRHHRSAYADVVVGTKVVYPEEEKKMRAKTQSFPLCCGGKRAGGERGERGGRQKPGPGPGPVPLHGLHGLHGAEWQGALAFRRLIGPPAPTLTRKHVILTVKPARALDTTADEEAAGVQNDKERVFKK